jgi:hypothetical protein
MTISTREPSHRSFQLLRTLLVTEKFAQGSEVVCLVSACLHLRRTERFRRRQASLVVSWLNWSLCLHLPCSRLSSPPSTLHLYFHPFYLISFLYSRKLRRTVKELNVRTIFSASVVPFYKSTFRQTG